MVLFIIAELAFTVAFKLSAWCIGKTFDGIMYIVKRHKSDDIDDEFIVISRQEYCDLKKSHENELHHDSSSSSSSSYSSSSSSSSEEAPVSISK
jgi:hypothetical protein